MPRNVLVGFDNISVAFERYVLELAGRFVSMPVEEIDGAIAAALSDVCRAFDVDFAALLPMSSKPGVFSCEHFHIVRTKQREIANFGADELSNRDFYFPWIAEQLGKRAAVVLNSLDDLPARGTRDRDLLAGENVVSAVFVPVTFGALGHAMLYVASRTQEQRWTESRIEWLKNVGRLFGHVLTRKGRETNRARAKSAANATQEPSARELSGLLLNAQEEERARLARELHDDITQRLARLAIDVGHIESGKSRDATKIADVRKSLVQLSEDVHALSYDLHPAVLVDLGLVDALRTECGNLSKQNSIPVDVKMRDLPGAVPRKVAIAFYRIAQESLRNAVRHGCSTQIDLSLRGVGGGLELAVIDNGIGFDPHKRRARPSLGMASMRERARLLDGEVDVESQPGHGTTVIAWIPLREDTL